MAEIRCPMCGKQNPPDLAVCKFCDARLVPLIAESPPEGEYPSQPAEESPSEPEAAREVESPDQEESSSDWLADLRQEDDDARDSSVGAEEDSTFDSGSPFEEEDEASDWLSRLGEEPEEDEVQEAEEPLSDFDEAESNDWLSRLGEGTEGGEAPVPEEAEPDFDWSEEENLEEAEIPDWISDMRAETEEATEDQESFEDLRDAEVPGWLQQMRQPEERDRPEQEISEEREELDFEPAESFDEAFEQDLDWLGDSEAAQDEDESEELPDWLKQVAEGDEESPAEPATEEALPDWLTDQIDEAPLEPETPPEWLAEAAGEPEGPAVSEEEVPDWFSEIPEEEIPDEIEAAPPPEQEAAPEPLPEAEVAPDWLSEIEPQAEGIPEIEGQEEPVEFEAVDLEEAPESEEPQPEEEVAVPDWLSGGEAEYELLSEVEDQEDRVEFEPADLEEDEEVSIEPFEEELEELYSEDLPSEWYPEEVPEEPAEAGEEPETEISRAEIPSWLESMRPVEDAAPSVSLEQESEEQVESAGPLAGLSGVLSAQPQAARTHKPPAYSVKLHVSENQNAHADLLKNMLAEEGQPKPIPRPGIILPQHLIRWAIGLILILAVLWPVITGSQGAPLPAFSPGTAAVSRLINQLPDQARVLLSFDYQPGLTGELDAAASPVVDHLMLRGAYLTLVSTSPPGPIVAERFLATTQADHNYTRGNQYVNLGYIPGGAAGLLSFAESPQRILPFTLDAEPAWGVGGRQALPPLEGVNRLADFSLVMVITDNPTVARAWVEQVQPYLETEGTRTPLVMVTSAQAEPLVRPYYQSTSSQVDGLVSGLRGGGAYALLSGRGGLPRKYWDSFSLGLLVAGVVIIVGGLVNVLLVVMERSKKS